MEYASTVKFRGERKSVDPANGKYGKPVGWFRTKENPGGWTMYNLDATDKAWFESQSEFTARTFRIVSWNDHTSIVRFSKKFGTVYFFDNVQYENTDLIMFEFDGVKLTRLYFD
jgi:hypothetical protein